MPPTASHDDIQRTRSHRLSRLTSPFKSSDVSLVRSPDSTECSMSPMSIASPLLDLPPTSSDSQGDYMVIAKTSFTPPAVSRSTSYQSSRPTPPAQAPLIRSLSTQTGTLLHIRSPSTSPTKRTGPFILNRSRKNSDVVPTERSGEKRLSPGSPSSGPSSPAKRTEAERSLFAHRRKSIAVPVISLPTNFKHTSGVSAAPLQNALQLAGLSAVPHGQIAVSVGEQTSAQPSPGRRLSILEKEESLEEALARVERALEGMPARFTNQQFERSSSAPVWQETSLRNELDGDSTDSKVCLGSAEQNEPISYAVVQGCGEGPRLSIVGDNNRTHESTSAASTSNTTKDSLRSPAMSPVRSLHRKPVPKLEEDLRTDMAAPPLQSENSHSAGISAADGAGQLPDEIVPTTPSCASVEPSQDWSTTLAEINAALKA